MVASTSAGWVRICLGVKGSTTMPYLPMRRDVRCGRGAGLVGAGLAVRAWWCGDWLASWLGLGLDYYGDDHGAAAVVVADPLADDAAG
jgi:hypothetical protein